MTSNLVLELWLLLCKLFPRLILLNTGSPQNVPRPCQYTMFSMLHSYLRSALMRRTLVFVLSHSVHSGHFRYRVHPALSFTIEFLRSCCPFYLEVYFKLYTGDSICTRNSFPMISCEVCTRLSAYSITSSALSTLCIYYHVKYSLKSPRTLSNRMHIMI